MLLAEASLRSFSLLRRIKIPPKILGLSVFTLPEKISGDDVKLLISVQLTLFSFNNLAVLPVANIS